MFDAKKLKQTIQKDGLIVFETDTQIALAGRAFSSVVERRIYELKQRASEKKLQVLVGRNFDLKLAGICSKMLPDFEKISAAFWPGALTVVVDVLSRTVGFRMPNHTLALDILDVTDPLYATSANISGHSPASTIAEARALFDDAVDLYIGDILNAVNGADVPSNIASTVVRLFGGGKFVILRHGKITKGEILQALNTL